MLLIINICYRFINEILLPVSFIVRVLLRMLQVHVATEFVCLVTPQLFSHTLKQLLILDNQTMWKEVICIRFYYGIQN